MHWSNYAVMGAYMLAVLRFGLRFSRGDEDTETYLLGGRCMPWWLIGISYLVSLLSTVSLVAVPGEAYENGLTLSIQSFIAPLIAVGAFHLFVRFYFMTRSFTPFEYLERRFDWRVRTVAAAFFWLTRLVYIGLVLYSAAEVFSGASKWPAWQTIMVVGGVGVLYTVLGGIRAVVWTDLVQFLVITVGLVFVMLKVLDGVPDGVTGIITYAVDHGRGMPAVADASFYSFSPYVRLTIWGIIIVVVNEQLFFNSADQIAIQRLLSTSSYRQAKRSLYTAAFGVVPLLMVLWVLGLAMFSFYGTQATVEQPESGDQALFHFIATQLPAPLPGLILAALLAAVMSTLDSGINSLATVATKDFYERFFCPDASERQQVAFSRWMTLLAGAFAIATGLLLSQLSESGGATVAESSMVWLTLSVALPPVFLLGVTSRRATARHALVQLAIGWVVTAGMIVWYLMSQKGSHPISFTCVGAPGPLLALVIGYGMSWTAPRSRPGELDGLTLWGAAGSASG